MMGGALGLAVLASLAAARTDDLLAAGRASLAALNGGYQLAFAVGAVFAAVAAVLSAALLPAGPQIDSHWRQPPEPGKETIMGNPVVHWELMSKDPAKVSDVLREDLRLEDPAHAGNELSHRRHRRRRRHQRRHPQAGARRPLARQHAVLYRRRRPRGIPQEGRRGGRQDPRRGAAGARHGRVLAVYRSRGTHDRPLQAETAPRAWRTCGEERSPRRRKADRP